MFGWLYRFLVLQSVEVSALVAGPAMGSLLQDLGADIIKIEPPVSGDPSRHVSPWGFLNYNPGKKSVSLNLKSKTGQEILRRLIKRKKVDIFIENLGPNVAGRLGISYETLSSSIPVLSTAQSKDSLKRAGITTDRRSMQLPRR